MARIAPGAVQSAVAAVLATEEGKTATTHLYVHLPVPDLPRATITTDSQAVHVDQAGAIAGPEGNAWSEFLLAVHYRLNIPGLLGLITLGILGVVIPRNSVVVGKYGPVRFVLGCRPLLQQKQQNT